MTDQISDMWEWLELGCKHLQSHSLCNQGSEMSLLQDQVARALLSNLHISAIGTIPFLEIHNAYIKVKFKNHSRKKKIKYVWTQYLTHTCPASLSILLLKIDDACYNNLKITRVLKRSILIWPNVNKLT